MADEDDVNPYGLAKESEEEKKLVEKNKPKFGEVQDKFARSARGPALGLLVLPVNLLIGAGSLACIAGVALVIIGLWPLVFNDASPSDEEYAEAIGFRIGPGVIAFLWGALICLGASKMQSLESYAWALAGAVMGVPLIAGIFALITLQDPRVRAGFEEVEGAIEDEDEEDEDNDEEDEDEEDDDEDEKPRKRRR
jgi:hypothetical protein